ncbi:centrosome and spindle pole-associated protein 1 isoform X4 [Alosa alosa]|uniref:centrosome and spindle pole-associated protein 1 isoform X4 n=1 Tax=Alosa alosa TaxID=278164 RepID=UPI0020152ACF|nr:centrosome and spindle pole-associated protein 1 isoform X4 [Alosa alosa]
MEEELEKFLMEQKERVAKDKASLLLQEPPYMEIRRRGVKFDELKENITLPSQKTTHNKEECVRLSLPLGEEYERKKQQLQQELRQDYRKYMVQKQCAEDSGVSSGRKLPPKMKDAATLTTTPHTELGPEGCVCVCEGVCVRAPQSHTHNTGVRSGGLSSEAELQIKPSRRHLQRERALDVRASGEHTCSTCKQWKRQQGLFRGRLGDDTEEEEEWAPPQEPRLAFQSPHQDYRVQCVPPGPPSMLHGLQRPPYDEAYDAYYYGSVPPLLTEGPYLPSHKYREANAHDGVPALGVCSSVKSRPSKDADIAYREALRQQIEERAQRKRVDREQRCEQEAREQAHFRTQQPWGRGGGGAPLRDITGNLITDLNQMHRLNEEAYINGSKLQQASGKGRSHTPQLASLFSELPSSSQQLEQDKYKAYLKQQIEDKRRRKAEEREREREQEEKEERRLAEQRERIQREYQEEVERRRRKELEQKLQNEELMVQAEERRRREAERRKREEEEEASIALRRQHERQRYTHTHQVQRAPSPPIPALQRTHTHHYSHRPPTEDCSIPGLQSPPVPACRTQMRAADPRQSILSELCVLRRRLRSEQQKLEGQLLQEPDSPPHDRHKADVFDMARLRMQASVRRPFPRSCEPYKDRDADTTGDLDYQAAHRQQLRTSSPRATDDFLGLSPPLPPTSQQPRRSGTEDCMGGSLLESESAFIVHSGMLPVPPEEMRGAPLSARERRRLKNQQSNIWPRSTDSPPEQNFSVRLRDRNTLHPRRRSHNTHPTVSAVSR